MIVLCSYDKYSESARELQLICPKSTKKVPDGLQIAKFVLHLHLQTTQNGVVVQLVRIPACHAGGREFESRPYRRKETRKCFLFCFWRVLETRDPLSLPYQGEVWRGCQYRDREHCTRAARARVSSIPQKVRR